MALLKFEEVAFIIPLTFNKVPLKVKLELVATAEVPLPKRISLAVKATAPVPPLATESGKLKAFCLPLNVVQSAADSVPVAEPEALGQLKIIVAVEVLIVKSVPVLVVLKRNVGPWTELIVVVAPAPVAVFKSSLPTQPRPDPKVITLDGAL